jgi:hypothetical protein
MENLRLGRLLAIILIGFFVIPTILVEAAPLPNPLQADDFGELIDSVINIIFNLSLLLAPLMIVVAGFLFVTAAGNPNRVNTAKRIVLWTAVGFLIILLSKGIFEAIKGLFSAP